MLLRAATSLSPMFGFAPAALGAFRATRSLSSATDNAQDKVGFIGLGAMGLRMAKHLLSAGRNLVVYDRNHLAVERFIKEKGESGGSATSVGCPAELAETPGVSVVFTLLPDPDTAREVYLGPRGLLAPPAGIVPRILVDCTTQDPPTAWQLAGRVRAARMHPTAASPPVPGLPAESPALLDAPVTGGIVGAERGSLSFLVGGEQAALAAVEPLLRAMGSHVLHCGDPGDAQAAKLCNTLVTAASMAATAEALALARRLGVSPEVMTRVLNSGSGRTWASEAYNPVPGLTPEAPSSQGYRGGLRASMLAEQLQLVIASAEQAHSPVPMARKALKLYSQVIDEGMGDQDFAAIYRYVYGSGSASNTEWRAGEQLWNAQSP